MNEFVIRKVLFLLLIRFVQIRSRIELNCRILIVSLIMFVLILDHFGDFESYDGGLEKENEIDLKWWLI